MAIAMVFETEEYNLANAELDRQDDRGCGIVSASLLEEHLLTAIKALLINTDDNIEGQFFKGYGPLASFRSKIDLAFLMGLYDHACHGHMNQIRNIRNKLAHQIKPLSFASPEILARVNSLPSPEQICLSWHDCVYFFEQNRHLGGSDKEEGIRIARCIAGSFLHSEGSPRQRFLLYIQHRIYVLNFARLSRADKNLPFLWRDHI